MMERYDSYKDSGVEWIGEIPSHWKKTKHKFNLSILSGYPFKSELFDKTEGFPLIRIRDISSGDIETYYQGEVLDKFVVNEGDLLIGMDGDFNTRWWNSKQGLLNQRCCSIIEGSNVLRRYLHYILPIELNIINDLTYFTTVKHLSVDDINNTETILPPLSEQQQIVSFLDTKTSLIDSLIEKTQRKIELLKEKRTSLINEVVTKGLNPNVEMKDSGVEWIGEIPSHWTKIKLSFLMEDDGFRSGPFGSSLITSQLLDKGRVQVLSPEFIHKGREEFPLFVPEERENELSKYLVKEGDIVIPIVGTIGRGKIIKKDDPEGILNQRLCRITPNQNKVNLSLLHLLLTESNLVKVQYQLEKRGSILDHITKEILFNFQLPIPPLSEQQQIVEYLDEQTQLIDNTISIEEKRIELLKEYRQSLISEVVTGKLKVTTDE